MKRSNGSQPPASAMAVRTRTPSLAGTLSGCPSSSWQPSSMASSMRGILGIMRPVALVTGGARRLGREIALELARQGWDLALHYRHSAAEAEATLRELREQGARAEGFSAELDD